jgi:hypothetical protein
MSGVAQEWWVCRSSFLNVPAVVPLPNKLGHPCLFTTQIVILSELKKWCGTTRAYPYAANSKNSRSNDAK